MELKAMLRRTVINGWRVVQPSHVEGVPDVECVFQDPGREQDDALAEAESLREAILWAFESNVRRKRAAGIVVEAKSGWEDGE